MIDMECLLLFLVLSETYEKGANELHREAALQDLNGQSDTGCIDSSNVGQTSSEANELHSEEALEDPNVQSDKGCIDSNVGQTSSAMLISADDTGRGNCDCAVPSQLIESAPTFIEVDDNNEYFI
ncbi:hypothetical protein EMCRGX_G006079 [Ephydatia muelleri]